jgi:hypothetical protein
MPQHKDGGHWFDCWYGPVDYVRAREIANQFARIGFEVRVLWISQSGKR